jgi:hypothetical protein
MFQCGKAKNYHNMSTAWQPRRILCCGLYLPTPAAPAEQSRLKTFGEQRARLDTKANTTKDCCVSENSEIRQSRMRRFCRLLLATRKATATRNYTPLLKGQTGKGTSR